MIYPPSIIKQGDRFQIVVFDDDGTYWRYSIGVITNEYGHLEMHDWKTGEVLAISKVKCPERKCKFKEFDFLKQDILRAVRENTYKAELH